MRHPRPSRIVLAAVIAGTLASCASGTRAPAGEPAPSGAAAPDSAPAIVLGPMVGHTTDESVRLWVRVDRSGELRAVLTGENGDVEQGRARTGADGIGIVTVHDLDPATRYSARFELNGFQLPADPPVVFRTFPAEGRPGRFRIALVSCARIPWDSVQTIWRALDADRPDAVLWLGDNGYLEHADSTHPADYEVPERIEFRYAQIKTLATLQPLLRHVPSYAIWDDRDFDGSDSDRTYPLRLEVTRVFERYWANPSYGSEPGPDGIYSRFSIGDVDVFLLDDRFYRDPDSLSDSPAKTVLGTRQKAWLKDGLEDSDARLKVIAIGHQVLADYHEWESYSMFRHERDELLDFIRERRIEGVVFVDGDRHLTELERYEPEGGYPLYDFTSSPVANRVFLQGLEIPNPIRVGGYSAGPSYGLLEIDTTTPEGRLVFVAKDVDGREVMRHETSIAALGFAAVTERPEGAPSGRDR